MHQVPRGEALLLILWAWLGMGVNEQMRCVMNRGDVFQQCLNSRGTSASHKQSKHPIKCSSGSCTIAHRFIHLCSQHNPLRSRIIVCTAAVYNGSTQQICAPGKSLWERWVSWDPQHRLPGASSSSALGSRIAKGAQEMQSGGTAKQGKERCESEPLHSMQLRVLEEKPHACTGPSAHPITHSPLLRPQLGSHWARTVHTGAGKMCLRGLLRHSCCVCCGALPGLARLARLFPPSAEPSTFIFVSKFDQIDSSTLI